MFLRYAGLRPVVVHGGGPQITAMLDRLGIDQRVPRRPAGDDARGHGRRPDGADRPGAARAGRPDQRARPVRGRAVRRGRRPVRRAARAVVVDGEHVDLGLVGDVVDGRPGRGASTCWTPAGSRSSPRSPATSTTDGAGPQRQRRHRRGRARGRARRQKLVVLTDVEGLYRDWPDRRLAASRRDRRRRARGAAARRCRRAWSRRWRPACARCAAACRRRTSSTAGVPHALLLEVFTERGHRHHGACPIRDREAAAVTGPAATTSSALLERYATR